MAYFDSSHREAYNGNDWCHMNNNRRRSSISTQPAYPVDQHYRSVYQDFQNGDPPSQLLMEVANSETRNANDYNTPQGLFLKGSG